MRDEYVISKELVDQLINNLAHQESSSLARLKSVEGLIKSLTELKSVEAEEAKA
jgi:hypothetical protein